MKEYNKFLITGSSRSGTSWMADILNHLVPCTHEGVFKTSKEVDWGNWEAGEVSFAAVPWLSQLDCPIFHQVRHPLKVISSEISHLTRDKGKSQAEIFYPDLKEKSDIVEIAIEYYIRHNEEIEKYTGFRYKVEEINTEIVERILTEAGYGGIKCPHWLVMLPPANTNPTPSVRKEWELTWDNVPEKYHEKLKNMVRKYKYEVD